MNAATHMIQGGDQEAGGTSSKQLEEMLEKIGVEPRTVRRMMIGACEAEMNVVIDAHKGVMEVGVDRGQVDVAVVDEGPGIPDIERATTEGYSTSPAVAREVGFGAGMGLPNVRKNTDRFSIQSTVGRGTQVRFTIFLRPQEGLCLAANSVHVAADQCQQCLRCLHVCPTMAMRVRWGRPNILNHLCVDCTSCIRVCSRKALTLRNLSEVPQADGGTLLVLPGAFLEEFGGCSVLERLRGSTEKRKLLT